MRLCRVFLSNAAEVNLLILRESHDQDWILLFAVVVEVADWHDTVRFVFALFECDVIRCHFTGVLVRRAHFEESVAHAALIAEFVTVALFM